MRVLAPGGNSQDQRIRYKVHDAFDLIFARNVFIYFDVDSRHRTISKLLRHLSPTGFFFLGHAESLNRNRYDLTMVSPPIYTRDAHYQAIAKDRLEPLLRAPLFQHVPKGRKRK